MRLSIAAALITAQVLSAQEVTLDKIDISSTSIDDRFGSKKTDVSSTEYVSGEKVDAAHIENLQQVLQSVSGITTEVKGGDSIKIHIRGIENQVYMGEKPGVAIVIDGVPVFERTGAVNIDLDNIESIKVIKGGASYLFGDDALAGAIIITTKRGAKYDHIYAAHERGSFKYQKTVVRAGVGEENYSGHLQVSERKSDGYWKDSDYLAKYANGKFQYYIDDTSDITFGLEASKREKDSHGTVEGVTQAEEDPTSQVGRDYTRKYDVELLKLFATYSKDFGDSSNLLFNLYQYGDDTNFVSAPQKYDAAGAAVTSDDAYTTMNDYEQVQRGLKSEYRRSYEKLAMMVGVDLRDNEYKNKTHYIVDFKTSPFSPTVYTAGTATGDDKTDENVYAAYLELKYALTDRLSVTGNYRHDTIKLDYTDYLQSLDLDKRFNVDSYRLGAAYQLSDSQSLYANVSTGFRAPTVSQLFAGSISPTGSTLNNTDLKPEEAVNFEIGMLGKTAVSGTALDYNIALFQIERDDYIMSSAGQYAKPDGTTSQYQNIGGMRNRGLEVSINSDRTQTFSFDMSYTYLQAKFTKYDNFFLGFKNPYSPAYYTEAYDLAGNYVPRTPKHHLNLLLDYRCSDKLTISPEIDARSSYYADELNRFRMPGYAVVNLTATYETEVKEYEVGMFARIDNLFDKAYYNTARAHTDRNYDGVYDQEDLSLTVNPGMVLTAGVSVKF